MTKKERALLAVQTLEEVYPQATCALQYEKPYELLIAVRLSAQCTDARVNQITPKLFAAYPTLESLAAADIADLEEIVRPCGFFHMKAKSIKEMSAQLSCILAALCRTTWKICCPCPVSGAKQPI